VAIVIGANPLENHPVAATYFKQFAKRGGKLIVMDPRGQGLKRFATHMLQFRPARMSACSTPSCHVIVEEGLYDGNTSPPSPRTGRPRKNTLRNSRPRR
jgi:formate dehydrogenase major subunit